MLGASYDRTYKKPLAGSTAIAPQLAPPNAPGIWMWFRRLLDGVYTPSFAALRSISFSRSRSSASRCGLMSFTVNFCRENGGGAVGNGWVGHDSSPGTSLF